MDITEPPGLWRDSPLYGHNMSQIPTTFAKTHTFQGTNLAPTKHAFLIYLKPTNKQLTNLLTRISWRLPPPPPTKQKRALPPALHFHHGTAEKPPAGTDFLGGLFLQFELYGFDATHSPQETRRSIGFHVPQRRWYR
jgi:hypothetical protein